MTDLTPDVAPDEAPTCRVVAAGAEFTGKQGHFCAPGISAQSVGARRIHLQIVRIPPGGRAKAHKHDGHESAIHILSGESGMRYGETLEQHLFARAGDFLYIPANMPHQPYNPSEAESCIALVARTDPKDQESVVLLPELEAPRLSQESEGKWLQITPGERFVIRTSSEDTKGAYTTLEVAADHRNGVRMHIHQNEDKHFIILEGTAHVACGNRIWDAAAGTAFTVRRGVPHAWCNLSESPLRMLVTFSPGRIEGLFRAVANGGNIDFAALSEKFGVRIVGPTLVEGLNTMSSPRS